MKAQSVQASKSSLVDVCFVDTGSWRFWLRNPRSQKEASGERKINPPNTQSSDYQAEPHWSLLYLYISFLVLFVEELIDQCNAAQSEQPTQNLRVSQGPVYGDKTLRLRKYTIPLLSVH